MHLLRTMLVLAASLTMATAHRISLQPREKNCFFEDLHKGDQMTVTYETNDGGEGQGGHLAVSFWITNPAKTLIEGFHTEAAGSYDFIATMDGRHEYCFESIASSVKDVSFDIYGVVYVPHTEIPQDPLEKRVQEVLELLGRAKDDVLYTAAREMTHRNTAESTNSRVKWCNLVHIAVLLGQAGFQVWWLNKTFGRSK